MGRPKKSVNGRGDSDWMREQLLDAAESLFAERGYEAASLRDIGKRVGVSNATLLHHYGAKLELYRAVLDRLAIATRTLFEVSAADEPQEPLAALVRFLERFTSWTRTNPNYGRIAFREFLERTFRETHLEYELETQVLRQVGELVRRGQRDGSFRADVDADMFVIQLLTTVWMGEISSQTWALLLDGETETFRDGFRGQALAHLLRGLVADDTTLERREKPGAEAMVQ